MTTPQVQVLAPGLVFIKRALSEQQQVWFAEYALAAGHLPDKGWWTRNAQGERVLNSDTGRGRIYEAVKHYPAADVIEGLCQSLVGQARAKDGKMPEMNPTHLLLLYYATAEGMYWHADADENDGDNDHPIVSVSLGNTAEFGYKLVGQKEATVLLESGDVLIWGGPNRMLLHTVHRVLLGTTPSYLPFDNARVNFTFRDAPNVLGKEARYQLNVDSNYTALLEHLLKTVPRVAL